MLDNETLQLLRQTLAAHVGGTLTLELCHELDKIARFAPDRAVDLAQFQPAAYGAYSLRPERFSVIRGELAPLHHAHWLETEKHRHGLTLNPDYGLLLARERAGGLLQFTARDAAGAIAGHVRMYIGKSTHTSTLFAEEDTLFIRSAEQALRQIGVREIRADSKLLNRADVLMRRLGYTAVALKFHKFFED
jgi:hypothetical protein